VVTMSKQSKYRIVNFATNEQQHHLNVTISPKKPKYLGGRAFELLVIKLGFSNKLQYPNALEENYLDHFTNRSEIYQKQQNLKLLQLTASFKGARHKSFLPVRGQRTHTNAKTRRKYKIS